MGRRHRLTWRALLSLVVASVALGSPPVSLIDLIANPQQHDGHRVSVYGIFMFEPGAAALYLSKDDAEHTISPNAIGLTLNPDTRYLSDQEKSVEPRKLSGRYVRVVGTVDATGTHTLQRWRVLLKDVFEVVEQEGTRRR